MGCVESLVHVYNASLVHVIAPYQESDLSIPDPSRRLTWHTPNRTSCRGYQKNGDAADL